MSKSESTLIEQRISEKITDHFPDNPKFVLGVSGGVDSMALLYALKNISSNVFVVHINYGLRADESDKDQQLVEGMSFEWGFECCSIRLNSENSINDNFQNWARKERYRIFNEIVREVNADAVIVAHHKDDQVETIIQKIFRGSSPEAWMGMDEWDGRIFRPLLEFSKAKLEEYCAENAIPFRTDQSNLESKYARNFVRNEFSEYLDKFFPGWEENILRLQVFGKINEQAVDALLLSISKDAELRINVLNKLSEPVGKAVLSKFLKGKGINVSRGQLSEILQLTKAQTGAKIEFSKGLSLVKNRGLLVVQKGDDEFEDVLLTKESFGYKQNIAGIQLEISNKIKSELYFDAGLIVWPLTIRRWKAGDRIQPLGMEGTQKVSDHLTNRKVPTSKKEKSLVLTGTDSTIYAIIFDGKSSRIGTISEICKATNATKQYLSITSKKDA